MGIQKQVARIEKQIEKQIKTCLNDVKRMLNKGDFSESSIEKAVCKITAFADKLEKQLLKTKCLEFLMHDDNDMQLLAQTAGDAIGEHTYAESNLKAGLMNFGNVSIAYASATSVAAAEGGPEFASTAAFADVTGGDVAFTRTTNITGQNFQKSTEYLFAVDFTFLKDFDIQLGHGCNRVINAHLDVPEGNTAIVNFDVIAQSEDTAVSVVADVLAVQDTLSSTYVEAGVAIG
jgi:hypothetical protein